MTVKPNSRTVLEVLAGAGSQGMISSEIAQRFDMDPHRALIEVNLYLNRARAAGRTRRGGKEPALSPAGRRTRAHRWFITPAGVMYLEPVALPAVTVLDEPPTTRRVMELLKEAGEEGMLAAVIARHFTIPDPHMPSMDKTGGRSQNLQRRLAWTNQILDRFLLHGYARRGPAEPSPYYHSVPCYRWFITGKGEGFLAAGMGPGVRAARAAEAERQAAARQARKIRQGELVTQAYLAYDPGLTSACDRDKVMRELRDAGCTLAEIGGVFGITRERVRQVMNGYRVNVCKCRRCTEQRWSEAGETAG